MSEWIKCSERLPEDDWQGWVALKKGYVWFAEFWRGEFFDPTDECRGRVGPVTHWMTKPDMPTEEA
jgi:hypothetical protein